MGIFCAWCGSFSSSSSSSSSKSSMKLWLFMVPLVMVMGLVFFLGPSFSNLVLIGENSPFFSWNSSSINITHPSSLNNNSSSLLLLSSNNNNGSNNVVVIVTTKEEEEKNKSVAISSSDDDANTSPAPPHSDQVMMPTLQQSNQTEVNLNNSKPNSVALNESFVPPQRKFSILDRTEAGLLQARAAIREARNWNQTQDPDYVPIGPMYRNAKAFHRSYLEMENRFKVFVYTEGEPPVFHNGPCKSIYSMEGNFIHSLEINEQFRTSEPEKAHVFFLPFSVVMMVRFVYERESRDFGPIKRTVTDYVNLIAGRYPYWNRSLGADHFMLACHDWGPETSFSVPYLHKNSIRVLCNANTSEGFNPAKDVSFPEINLRTGTIEGFTGGPPASKRPILAFFAGGLHGPIRPVLLEHWENKDEDIKVQKYLPKGVSYYDMLRKSKFCLCPSGYEVASPRVVEAIYTGCVPVLISDHYVAPFSDVLNWKSFSVEVSVSEIPKLKEILMSISPRQYIRMQRRVGQIRKHFEVNFPPKRFDVFHMILHSVWLRRLNVRIHDDDQ